MAFISEALRKSYILQTFTSHVFRISGGTRGVKTVEDPQRMVFKRPSPRASAMMGLRFIQYTIKLAKITIFSHRILMCMVVRAAGEVLYLPQSHNSLPRGVKFF